MVKQNKILFNFYFYTVEDFIIQKEVSGSLIVCVSSFSKEASLSLIQTGDFWGLVIPSVF